MYRGMCQLLVGGFHGSAYWCYSCKDIVHEQCKLEEQPPPEIKRSSHPGHLLYLGLGKPFYCDVICSKFIDYAGGKVLSYSCHDECRFQMDIIRCTLKAPTKKSEEEILHGFHPHPLYFWDHDLELSYFVTRNKKGKGSGPYYYCRDCDYRLHKSYAEVSPPQEIEHPFHAGHRDLGLVITPPSKRCNSCNSVLGQICFHCDQCHFYMCLACSHLTQLIKYKSHPHHLRFVEDLPSHVCCDANESICKSSPLPKEFRLTQGRGFQCVKCNFKIHLLCGPLSCTIKHNSPVDSLTLEDSIMEDDDPNDEYSATLARN